MAWHQNNLSIRCENRGTYDITAQVQDIVRDAGIDVGVCHVFIKHTSASLILCENADPVVRDDLERFMHKLVPDGDRMFQHTAEGPDDMPAHVRSVLTQSSLTMPVSNGSLALGTWQGIYLWEHRTHPHMRTVIITIQGE